MTSALTVIKIRYHSTNCYFIDTGNGLLAFDVGWPGTYTEYKDGLKEQGYSVKHLKWFMVSHFHIDHAGLAGMLVANGVAFVVFTNQLDAIREMEQLIERKKMPYRPIDLAQVRVMEIAESRAWLAQIGIQGEVLHTPGHGEQSIALLLDTGEAFIGDLAPETALDPADWKSRQSWALLRRKGARHIRPAHASEYGLA